MAILLLSLILLGILTALFAAFQNRNSPNKPVPDDVVQHIQDMECCGQHEVCEKEELLKAMAKGIEYFDDEDLDIYSGRAADSFTDDEEDDFRNVLYTMKESEVKDWVRSLQMRGIELPEGVRDEALFVMQSQ